MPTVERATFQTSFVGSNNSTFLEGDLNRPLFEGAKKKKSTKDDVESQIKDCLSTSYWYWLYHWREDYENIMTYVTSYVIYFICGVMACFIAYYFSINIGGYENTAPDMPSNIPSLNIVLLGDSLFNRPYKYFNLAGLLYNHLAPINATFINEGVDGNQIHQIAARLEPILQTYHPDALLLFWDSDISDNDQADMTTEQFDIFRANYIANLTYVINTTLSYGTQYMAVAGPGLLGENRLVNKIQNQDKYCMLDEFRDINRNVSLSMGVSYIDIRSHMLAKVPWFWPIALYFITQDGEHLNYRGVHMLAKLCGDALRDWLTGNNSTIVYQQQQQYLTTSSSSSSGSSNSGNSMMQHLLSPLEIISPNKNE